MASVLTAKSVENARPDPNKRIEKPDAVLTGLYLVIQPSGARSWALRYRKDGKPAKLTIGPVLDRRQDATPVPLPLGQPHTLAEARTVARAALQVLAEGREPSSVRRAQEEATRATIEFLGTQFIERYCKPRNRNWAEVERQFRVEINPVWGARSAVDIAKRDVLDLLDGIVNRGSPITANRVFATLRRFFGWLVDRDMLTTSPCERVTMPSAEESRDRILTDREIRTFWQATEQFEYPFGPMWRLLLLTGQRRQEVSGMTWKELPLDDDKPVWTIPASRTKNNEAHTVPLSPPAVDIIKSLPRIAGSPFCFTTTGETHVTGYSRSKRRLDTAMLAIMREKDADAEMPSWTLHDLRRTMASGMAKLGINLPVIEKILNHTSGSFAGIVGVYQRHGFSDEKRKALETWGRFVTELVESKLDTNVITLKMGRT